MNTVIATFSIVARDANTGELGVAVQSKFLAVGSAVPWAKANVGAIATQAWANVGYGPRGLALLELGHSAQEVVDKLLADDEGRDHRQIGVVDSNGNAASWTGVKCMDWAGHRTGDGYTCQGNILVGQETVDAMARAYEGSSHLPHLADRLLVAIEAAQEAGGDSRGKQSSAMYVVRENGGYSGFSDRLVDLRVDDHPEPIRELRRLLDLHRQIWLNPTPPERFYLSEASQIKTLQSLLREIGVFDGAVSGELTYNTRGSLATWCRERGYGDLDPSGGWIPGDTMAALWAEVRRNRQSR